MDSLFHAVKMISGMEVYGCVAAAGITSHLAYFIRGEHHLQSPMLFRLALGLFAVGVFAQVQLGHLMAYHALTKTTLIFSIYFTSLFSSMVLYRVFFHPLKGFPGPFLVKTSKLWHMFHLIKVNNFKWLDSLHRKYGDVVRTGECNLMAFRIKVQGPPHDCQGSLLIQQVRMKSHYLHRMLC